MDIRFDRPTLNRATPEENIAIIDRWMADTVDKLNAFVTLVNREREGEANGKRSSN